MNKDLVAIFEYLEREKGIKREVVIEAIKESLEIAARNSIVGAENIEVIIHPKTGVIEVFCDKIVVEKVTKPTSQISLKEVKQHIPHAEIGKVYHVAATPKDFGRIAAQKSKQLILQRLKSAERDVIYEEYRHRVNTLISGTVKRVGRGDCLIVDLGKVEGIMPKRHHLPNEQFNVGYKVLALLLEVRDTEMGGAEVIISRTDPEFVKQLFLQEVPECSDGTVVIERIVREPGYRTKMLVRSNDQKVDPVGSCIGVRGSRIKNVVKELGLEKVDVIPYTTNFEEQLERVFHPVVIQRLKSSEDGKMLSLVVEDDDFPTAIGKKGMNVRLVSELLNVQLDVKKMSDYMKFKSLERATIATSDDPSLDLPLTSIEGIPGMIVDQLIAEGFTTPRLLLQGSPESLSKVAGVTIELADKILENIRKIKA
jgi:N utilization substance protein A